MGEPAKRPSTALIVHLTEGSPASLFRVQLLLLLAAQTRRFANLAAEHANAAVALARSALASEGLQVLPLLLAAAYEERVVASAAASRADAAFKHAADAWSAHNARFAPARSAPTRPQSPTAAASSGERPACAATRAQAKRPSGGCLITCSLRTDACCTGLPMARCSLARVARAAVRTAVRTQRGGRR